MQTTSRIRPFLIIFAAVFLLSAHKALGFRPSPHTTYFKVTDMQSGLPDNCVNDITEDPYGFIWVATWNGIARFDGKNVEVFRHDESPDMPGINMARALLADTDGIWICEDGGVSFLRFADNQFIEGKYTAEGKSPTRISRRVSHIIRQGDNVVIQSSDGELMSLDRNATDIAKGKITFRRVAKPSDRFYTDIVPFSGGRIMAVSNDGITVLSGDAAKELCHTRIEGLTYDNNLNLFCDLVNGRVYVGCGIGEKSHAYKIHSSKGDVREISDVHVPDGLMETAQIGATVYFATDGYGLQVLNPDGSTISYSPGNSSLPCDALYTIHADRNGNIWCGSYRHGICMLSKELNSYTVRSVDTGTLSYNIVTSIVKDGHTLYLGLDGGGIDIYNTATDTSVNLNTDNSALPGNNVVSLVKDPSTLWAATYSDGLAEIDLNSRSIRTHAMPDSGDGNDKLWVIVDDGNGNLWAGGGSLYVFNKASKTFSRVSGCENLTIMSIINDGDSMWVATRLNGVLKINKKTRKMTARFSNSPTAGGGILPGKQAEYLYIDSRRNLWININNKDLCVVNADKGGKAKIYNSHNGLINNVVNAIVEDAKGDLWIGTNDGLYKYIRANDSFVKKKDSRIPTTFIHSAAATAGDVAYFGTTAGVLDFRMTDPPSLGRSMPVVFTSLNILDNEKTSLSLYSQENPEVKLEHSQNFFTVRFSVPEMSNPDQLQFECRLEGLEDVWQDASTTRSVTYTNVPAGDYFLLVRHTNPDGSWSEPSRMAIHVKSPWYASTSMLLVWAALALLFTYFIARMRHKFDINKKKTERAELERDSAKKLNEAKLDFYATISHELRTPCFLISAQIEEIMDSDRQTVPVSTLTGIYRNSNKLNKLINHIIDFRKNDNGLLKLNPRKVELVKFLENLTYDYEQLCRQKSLTFSYVHDAPPIEARVDSDKIEQIVTNLISNAYKYTPKGGSVTLSLRLLDDTAPGNSADPASGNKTVEISVSDTGIGIMEKLQDKIFKPFFRTERGEAQSYGDGIGLAFVRELVELHGGTIALDSKINEGSTFIVTIPLDARHNSENSVAITNSKTAAMADFNDTDAFADIDNTPHFKQQLHLKPPHAPQTTTKIINPTATRAILIIDDDPEVRDLVARAFEGDYRVETVADGKAGLEMASSGRFDVIITDLMMPEMDGHELIRNLKANRKTAGIKIIVLSALASETDMVQVIDEGADAFILKPTPLKFLRRKVDGLFERNSDSASSLSQQQSGQYNREEQKFLLECRRIIDENLSNEDFGIEMLAARLAMSHSALYKKIRRMTDMSLIEFINDYKIYKAVGMFRGGVTNVQRVSEACGFRDVKTFRESFKKKMGMPPKQFISTLNQEE